MTNRGVLGVCVALALFAVACGNSNSPTTPSPTTPSSKNGNPVIGSVSVSPMFGVSGLTTISMTATGTDPDGDPLTFSWTAGATTLSGASASAKLTGDGPVPVVLTVTDGKGGSATASRTATIGTMTGRWSLVTTTCGVSGTDQPGIMTLTQTGGLVTGNITWPASFCNIRSGGDSGEINPNAPATIDDQGNFVAPRIVAEGFQEFNLKGKMDSTGRVVSGPAGDSGFAGEAFTMTKQ